MSLLYACVYCSAEVQQSLTPWTYPDIVWEGIMFQLDQCFILEMICFNPTICNFSVWLSQHRYIVVIMHSNRHIDISNSILLQPWWHGLKKNIYLLSQSWSQFTNTFSITSIRLLWQDFPKTVEQSVLSNLTCKYFFIQLTSTWFHITL